MDYTTANAKLTGRNRDRRKLANNTYLERRSESGSIAIRLHNTDIITLDPDGSITLDSGGWKTVTTKARINDYIGNGLYVSQERGQWYVCRYAEGKHETLGTFADGMRILADRTIEGMGELSDAKQALILRRKVQRYSRAYVTALFAGEVGKPGAGDCFYCQLREVKTGAPLGEVSRNLDHLLSHLQEKYFVPSILNRVFEVMPVSQIMKWAVAEKWYPEQMSSAGSNGHSFADDYTRTAITKVLSKYLLRQLGQAS